MGMEFGGDGDSDDRLGKGGEGDTKQQQDDHLEYREDYGPYFSQ